MEQEVDLEAFLQQIRSAPLSREMIGVILSRLNDAENLISAADAEDENIHPEETEGRAGAYTPPGESEFQYGYREGDISVSEDSGGEGIEPAEIVGIHSGLREDNDFEAQPMYPPEGDYESEEYPYDYGVEMPRTDHACLQCEEHKRSIVDLQQKYGNLKKDYDKFKVEAKKDLISLGELGKYSDSELSELEKRLKENIERVSAEKEEVTTLIRNKIEI